MTWNVPLSPKVRESWFAKPASAIHTVRFISSASFVAIFSCASFVQRAFLKSGDNHDCREAKNLIKTFFPHSFFYLCLHQQHPQLKTGGAAEKRRRYMNG